MTRPPSSCALFAAPFAVLVLAAAGFVLGPGDALAQEATGSEEEAQLNPDAEEPDPTRLDVERLPPEAIEVTRDLYAHGFFVEAQLGGRGFYRGVGDVLDGGPWAVIGIGYEIVDWLLVMVAAEGSLHETNAPAPPATSVVEILGGSASLRVQANFTEAFALWLGGTFGVLIATTDILQLYGFQDATTVGITYGGDIGADWHLRARHYSIGLLGGVRHDPSLESPIGRGPAIGIHGNAYMRYVF